MSTNLPNLLVVMPVYNSQRTLSMAIESILNQSYKNLKLVIVDDASTDKSLEIASMYLEDKRVVIYKNLKNMGAYYSRNVGLYLHRNDPWEYFTTHDSDDISFEHRYLKMVRLLRRPRYLAVQDTFRRINMSTGKVIAEDLTMAHAAFSRVAFAKIGYFENVRFGADWEYWNRLNTWNKMNRYKTAAILEVQGESFIHDRNLTVTIPINSPQRLLYVRRTRAKMRSLVAINNYYQHFDQSLLCTERVT